MPPNDSMLKVIELCHEKTVILHITQISFTVTEIQNFKPLAILCVCTAWFISDLLTNPVDRSSCVEAQLGHQQIQTFRTPANPNLF